MDKDIITFIDGIKANKQVVSFDENAIKQTIVMKLLFMLGWDIFNSDEVSSNYAVGKRAVDFCLRIKNTNKIFIIVKKAGEPLDRYQNELFEYAKKEKVAFSILTNGTAWWFYSTSDQKNVEQKKFCSVDFHAQDSDDIAKQLVEFIEKKQIENGEAFEVAEKLIIKRNQKLIEETFPQAWSKVISEPNEVIVNLLSETTGEICGFVPEREAVIKFLTDRLQQPEPPTVIPSKQKAETIPDTNNRNGAQAAFKEISVPPAQSRDRKPISSFQFKQKNYNVKSWDGLVLKLCDILKNEYKQDIERLLWHPVGKKYYFSKNADELRFPENIEGTEIFVQTHLNPNEAVSLAKSVVSFFGFAEQDFSV